MTICTRLIVPVVAKSNYLSSDVTSDAPMGKRHEKQSISSDNDEGREELLEEDDGETSSGRPSLTDFPSSCFELRPPEACLYTVYDEGTTMESDLFKMALTDDQVERVAEICSLPNSLEQLLLIIPKVQEYLDEGVTTFKILSATESDGSRCSYIISSSASPLSGSSSSAGSTLSLTSIDF